MTQATYRIPQTVIEDTYKFRKDLERFLSGETSPVAFRGLRVPMGIYEQRTSDTYMVRVRCAAGTILSNQAKKIANLSDSYGDGNVHITTRQDLQIHGVKIENTPDILEQLLEVGLSSRGGGGNTVRNISACPLAGICHQEVFDVTPYALALTEYLMEERGNFNLPRKFKAAFSGCSKDCGLCSVADLGFFAHKRNGENGFSVYAGGGMGAHSSLGIMLQEFVPANAVFEVAEAVKRMFDKHGDRTNRERARLRFVVERLGGERFKQLYLSELEQVREEGISTPEICEEGKSTIARSSLAPEVVHSVPSEWAASFVIPQKQIGKFTVLVPVPLGNLTTTELRDLADAALSFGDGTIRTTQGQDIHLRGIDGNKLYDAYSYLQTVGERLFPAAPVRCVACAGASTCKLGLCLSRELAAQIENDLAEISLPFEAIVRISGCPNSCGQHAIAPLGLYGGAKRINGRLVPFYTIVAEGNLKEGNSTLAKPVAKVPARSVPALLKEFFTAAAPSWQSGDTIHTLMSRWGTNYLRELARNYHEIPTYEEAPYYYRDFGSTSDFSLAGRGPGECSAGVTDVISLDIEEAQSAINESRLYEAVVAACRALLVTKGLEPQEDRDVFTAFSEHLIEPGWVSRTTKGLLDAAVDFKVGKRDTLEDLRGQIEGLVNRVGELFLSLDSNFKFRAEKIDEPASSSDNVTQRTTPELDLRGVACPMNFVRAKIQLEHVEVGQVLEIILDNGDPARNVAASFIEHGQEVLSKTDEGDHSRIRVRRLT